MEENSNNKNPILIVIITILTLLLLGLTYYTFFMRNNSKSIDENTKINYEIKKDDESSSNEIEVYNLYVNNKKVENLTSMGKMKISEYNNLLLVEYFDTYNSNIVFINNLGNKIILKSNDKYEDIYKKYVSYRLDGKNVYVKYELLYNQGDIYYFCDLKSDDIVTYEQKYEYLGNDKFSNGTIVNEEKVSEHKFDLKCEDKNK